MPFLSFVLSIYTVRMCICMHACWCQQHNALECVCELECISLIV